MVTGFKSRTALEETLPMLRKLFVVASFASENATRATFFLVAPSFSKPDLDKATNIFLADAVEGFSMPKESTKMIWPSFIFFERAMKSALARIFAGIGRAKTFVLLGPWVTPPPFQIGERDEPWRARPVPFCFHGLRPPPRTSPRPFVCATFVRALSCIEVTTWCIKESFHATSKMFSGSSREPAFLPCAL